MRKFLLTEHMGLREPGRGSRALEGQAVAVVPNRRVKSEFRFIYTILLLVGGPTHSTILPCSVHAENIFQYSVYTVE